MTEVDGGDRTIQKESRLAGDIDIKVSDHGEGVYSIIDVGGTLKRPAMSLGKGLAFLRHMGVDVERVIIVTHDKDEGRFSLDAVVLGKDPKQT